MRISTEQLPQHLARELRPLYTVFGDEPLLAIEAADRVRARARADGCAEREVLTVEPGFRWPDLAAAGSAQSLFSARRLLEIRIPSGKPGTEGGEALQRYCAALPPDTVTLVELPGLDWRAQKAEWFNALDAAGVLIEAKPVARKALPDWLAGRLAAQGQEADPETLEFIATRVEGNLLAAYQEVQKLALLHPPGRLSFEQVREAVLDVARYDVYGLGATLLQGDALQLVRTLDGLRGEGVGPPLVLWALTEEIRALGRVLEAVAAGKQPAQMWRELNIYGAARQAAIQQHVRRFTREQVEAAMAHAARTDRMIKGLVRGDVWDELLRLALRFARGGGAPARRTEAGRAAQQKTAPQSLF